MTCQRCREEATVHLTESVDGRVREVHLCGACAQNAGLTPIQPPPDLALDAILDKLITTHVGELVGELAQRSCPLCGLKYMEFRTGGRLGCPHDYAAFDKGILPILRRAHGATRHVGKVPARRPTDPGTRLRLRSQLRRAVSDEHYEEAARLRDLLRQRDLDR